MTACHDPYKELELYLQKAQEEIGKAVKELEEHQETESFNEISEFNHSNETLVLPPHGFRSQEEPQCVNRVCHDGLLLDNEKLSKKSHYNECNCTTKSTFFSNLKPGISLENGKGPYPPSVRKKMWRMHPSFSFPETSKDLLILGQELTVNKYFMCNNTHMNYDAKSSTHSTVTAAPIDHNGPKYRQRSHSDTSAPYFTHSTPEEFYPRPPSGDVNLLSIWADNLVLDLDKSLMEELNSFESHNTSLDSLSPTKQDIPVKNCYYDNTHLSVSPDHKFGPIELCATSLSIRTHKEKSISPDSGIEQTLCDTPETFEEGMYSGGNPQNRTNYLYIDESIDFEDNVNSIRVSKKEVNGLSYKDTPEQNGKSRDMEHCIYFVKTTEAADQYLGYTDDLSDCLDSAIVARRRRTNYSLFNGTSSNLEVESIAPPTQFVDNFDGGLYSLSNGNKNDRSQATQTEKPYCTNPNHLKKAAMISESLDRCELIEHLNHNSPCIAPTSENHRNEDTYTLSSVSVVNDASRKEITRSDKDQHKNYDISLQNISSINSVPISDRIFFSLPVSHRPSGKYFDQCNSLNKRNEKYQENFYSQRSISQSAISNIGYSGIEELAEFMRQMKSKCNQPLRADVSTDMKEDKEIKDAITQTSPLVLSRSSSFTSVTDCDCSDFEGKNLISASDDDSLTAFKCVNCQKDGSNARKSSSSSFVVSSDDDDDCPASPGSRSSSSLYLSACSGSSDSFDEATITEFPVYQGSTRIFENDFSVFNIRALQSSETTLRGSVLGDISEEQGTTETICTKSSNSNPSVEDSLDHPASFPSTLKLSRKKRFAGGPVQPIEPEVLIINNMNLKSVSAPVLLRQKRHVVGVQVSQSSSSDSSPPSEIRNKDPVTQVPARAHSAKELNELQAIEACSWLRAAGFPQYAQMYEDNQFPIDVSIVQKDHAFLHPDSIQSLFRRLNTLNRCAKMKFKDHVNRASLNMDESDEEEQYALSENWEFQRSNRRWSRIPSPSDGIAEFVPNDPPAPAKTYIYSLPQPKRKLLNPDEPYGSSHDSVFADDQCSSPDSGRRSILKNEKMSATATLLGDYSPGSSSGSGGTLSLASEDMQPERRSIRRSGSDRVKEGARAILKRMESLKGKRKKKVPEASKTEKTTITQSGTDGSSSSSLTSSPQFRRSQKQVTSSPETLKNVTGEEDDLSTHSDIECRLLLVSENWNYGDSNETNLVKSKTSVTVTSPQEESNFNFNEERTNGDNANDAKKNLLHPNSFTNEETNDCDKRGSYYDNVCAPLVVFNEYYAKNLDENGCCTPARSGKSYSSSEKSLQNQEYGDIIIVNNERRDSGVGSSLTRGITYQQAPWHCFPFTSSSEAKSLSGPLRITDLTAPQILLLRKLSLLKLTTIMEKFSPSSRTGWSWGVSKFIGKIRNPDYKDKVVFGVPLLLILQRTGQPLPVSIQAAIHYLRTNALDSTGIFRKSGVRSRIQKLKSLNETIPDKVSYEEQQVYDVADMLKQYFRELPEALLTNKLSETFISIFQFVPEDLRLEAIHSALMLMPDENREVLQSLLGFLYEVCQHSGVNQMTATNIAVCLAPSLFHLSSPRSSSSSPRRRKTVGVPDLRELNENRAAYECLSCMVSNYETLFTVTEEIVSQSRISSASFSQPISIEEICSFVSSGGQTGWKGYIDSCIQMFLKEAKDKYKGWKTVSQNDHVDLAYKKVVDGHPLKLWKVSTEVEAPPTEVLNRVLRERHVWDTSFTKGKVISRFSKQSEVVQYQSSSLPPHPPCDFCVLRSWKTDLPKGACILVETSVEHLDAEIPPTSVAGLILSSRYLIEPCGSGKSRITHISRVDSRGRSPEWYNRAYGHICTLLLVKLRNSFSRSRADLPETKV